MMLQNESFLNSSTLLKSISHYSKFCLSRILKRNVSGLFAQLLFFVLIGLTNSVRAADSEQVPSFESLKAGLNLLFGSEGYLANSERTPSQIQSFKKIDATIALGIAALNAQIARSPQITHIDLFTSLVNIGAIKLELLDVRSGPNGTSSDLSESPTLKELIRFSEQIAELTKGRTRGSNASARQARAKLAQEQNIQRIEELFDSLPTGERELLSLLNPSNLNTKSYLRELRENFRELIAFVHNEDSVLKNLAKAKIRSLELIISKPRKFEWIYNFNRIWDITHPSNVGYCKVIF